MMAKFLIAAAALATFAATSVHAKLPPPTPEQQAKAAEAAARTAWNNKVADFQLCRAMDRVAAHLHADMRKRGATPPAVDAPACVDPGPFVPPAPPAPAAAPAKP